MDQVVAPTSYDELQSRLIERLPNLPKRLRQCAEFVAAHPDRISFATVAEVAEAAGVQPSAVVRFCQELGFSGYGPFQQLFRDRVARPLPDYATRIAELRAMGRDSPHALLVEFAEAGRLSLQQLVLQVGDDQLNAAVAVLAAARTIHVVGYRRAFPVAAYFAYVLEKLDVPVMLHAGTAGFVPSTAIQSEDALLAITFAPYTQATVDLAEAAFRRGAKVIGITDSLASPLHQMGALVLLASEVSVGAFRPLSAPLTLAMTLAVSLGGARAPKPDPIL